MKSLIEFIKAATDCWHTTAEVKNILKENGFEYLPEEQSWDLKTGGKYYTTRNMSSLIAFKIPQKGFKSYMIGAAHGESPGLKLKAIPQMSDGNYIRLNTELYGGPVLTSWFDRPLSVSGRVVVENGDCLETRLVNIDKDLLVIPSVAPHLDRTKEINVQRDLIPLYALCSEKNDFMEEVALEAKAKKEQLLGCDLMVYNREEGRIWGANNEFISAPRLDDLQCVYSLLNGFLEGENHNAINVYCVFDNEEVGSGTKQGAKSDFLPSVMRRINESFGKSYQELCLALASSFMVSADNAHGIHPNRKELSDCDNFPVIGKGVVIKYNASQKYTTDAVSEAIFKKICDRVDVPRQVYVNKSDIAGGSTLGNLAAEKTCVNTVDVGLPQLAMHSAWETAGADDTEYLTRAMKEFYSVGISVENGNYKIK